MLSLGHLNSIIQFEKQTPEESREVTFCSKRFSFEVFCWQYRSLAFSTFFFIDRTTMEHGWKSRSERSRADSPVLVLEAELLQIIRGIEWGIDRVTFFMKKSACWNNLWSKLAMRFQSRASNGVVIYIVYTASLMSRRVSKICFFVDRWRWKSVEVKNSGWKKSRHSADPGYCPRTVRSYIHQL